MKAALYVAARVSAGVVEFVRVMEVVRACAIAGACEVAVAASVVEATLPPLVAWASPAPRGLPGAGYMAPMKRKGRKDDVARAVAAATAINRAVSEGTSSQDPSLEVVQATVDLCIPLATAICNPLFQPWSE